jgi:hypothetical protein
MEGDLGRAKAQRERSVEVLHRVSIDTGREIIADAPEDPFLEPYAEYILLVVYSGARPAVTEASHDDDDVGVARILAAFEPENIGFSVADGR